jgi:hypothetical protein
LPAFLIKLSSGGSAYRSSVTTLEDHSVRTTEFYLAAATAAAAIAATPALADHDRTSFDGMNEQGISQIVTYAAYDVVNINRDGRIYRVEAYELRART